MQSSLPLVIGILSLLIALATGAFIVVRRSRGGGLFRRMTREERLQLRSPIIVYWFTWVSGVILTVWWFVQHVRT